MFSSVLGARYTTATVFHAIMVFIISIVKLERNKLTTKTTHNILMEAATDISSALGLESGPDLAAPTSLPSDRLIIPNSNGQIGQ